MANSMFFIKFCLGEWGCAVFKTGNLGGKKKIQIAGGYCPDSREQMRSTLQFVSFPFTISSFQSACQPAHYS